MSCDTFFNHKDRESVFSRRALSSRRCSQRKRRTFPDMCCKFWLSEEPCPYGEKCRYAHSHQNPAISGQVSFLTKLRGHDDAITGIAFSGGKLYSGGLDGKLYSWDSDTGKGTCIPLNDKIGSIMEQEGWIFVGTPNAVKAYNSLTSTEQILALTSGQVHALIEANGMLVAGCQDGHILLWKLNSMTNVFEPATFLKGHTKSIISLATNGCILFSGSLDNSIMVWNLETFQLMETLKGDDSAVISLLFWSNYLFSSYLDGTVKTWSVKTNGALVLMHSQNEKHGIISMCGINDPSGNPVLACGCLDNIIRLYDMPSFKERGRLFSREEVRVCKNGPGGLIFTGDGLGEIKIWKWENCCADQVSVLGE